MAASNEIYTLKKWISREVSMTNPAKDINPVPLPAPNSDFYGLMEILLAEEFTVLRQVRTFVVNRGTYVAA